MRPLRTVAAEIGMSFSGLRTFLKGKGSLQPNQKKLVAWYVRVGHPAGKPIDPEVVEFSTAVLARHLEEIGDPTTRVEAAVRIVKVLLAGLDPPVRREVRTMLSRALRERRFSLKT